MSYDIGPKIGIEGEAEFRQAITGINTNLKTLGTEMMAVTSKFDKNEKSTESLTAKNKVLNKQIGEQKSKLSELEKGLSSSADKYGDNDKATQGWRQAVNKATADLNNMERELNNNNKELDEMGNEAKSAEKSLNGLEDQAAKTDSVLSKDDAVKNLKNIAKTAAVAGAALGAAFVGMANAAIGNADELQRQSDVTGLSAERLQELAYAGGNLGVELDTITGAQAKLTKSMDAAREGTGAQADAFKALGINVLDSNGQLKSSEEVMNDAFTALNGVGNETERDALAMTLFGKSAMEMNPMIKAGGDELARLSQEARDNGAVMSNEAVAGLDSFGDTIDNLKSGILGTFGEKFAEILPNVQGLIDGLKELPQWIDENSTKLTLLGVAVGTITALVIAFNIQQALLASGMTLWGAIAAGATIVTTGLGAAFAFLTSPIGLVVLAIGAVIAIGVLLYKNWDIIKERAVSLKEKISNLFDFEWKLPEIKLPHFDIQGEFSLSPPSMPTLGVEWYDKGAIFNSPSIIGVGEKRPEFVGALDDLRYLLRDELRQGSSNVNHTGTIRVEGVNSRGELVAVVEQQITNNITSDNRRIPNRTSLIPIG